MLCINSVMTFNFDFEKLNLNLKDKLLKLKNLIKSLNSVVIAFSGGVDSTFLSAVAFEILKYKCIALHLVSPVTPKRETEEAKKIAKVIGINFDIIPIDILSIKEFKSNTVNRCYYCKKEVFSILLKYSKDNKYNYVVEGSNLSDDSDYRPGRTAIKELNILSPLKECGLTKREILQLSDFYDLPTKSKSSFACLSSRIPYNDEITEDKLKLIEKAEDYLFQLGFKQFRVRYHNKIARIEIEKDMFEFFMKQRESIVNYFKNLGFIYVTLDLEGYKTGSMNIF